MPTITELWKRPAARIAPRDIPFLINIFARVLYTPRLVIKLPDLEPDVLLINQPITHSQRWWWLFFFSFQADYPLYIYQVCLYTCTQPNNGSSNRPPLNVRTNMSSAGAWVRAAAAPCRLWIYSAEPEKEDESHAQSGKMMQNISLSLWQTQKKMWFTVIACQTLLTRAGYGCWGLLKSHRGEHKQIYCLCSQVFLFFFFLFI